MSKVTRRMFVTAALTTCLTLLLVYQADAIDCYHCTQSGGECSSNEVEESDNFTGSCAGSSQVKSKCTYCSTENQTNPNGKTILKSRCETKNNYNPDNDECDNQGNNGQPIVCITWCNSSLCNYDCYESGADQLTKPIQAILPALCIALLILNEYFNRTNFNQ